MGILVQQVGTAATLNGTLDRGRLTQGARLQQCPCRVVLFCIAVDIVWDGRALPASGNVQDGQCLSPSRVGTAERRHCVRNHLERPRWQRCERRCERRAAVWRTPLAREHDGDEHLEPLHADASRNRLRPSTVASAAALRLCAIACSHATKAVGVATRARNADITGARLRGCSTPTHWRRAVVRQRLGGVGWRRTSARTAATHSCAADRA